MRSLILLVRYDPQSSPPQGEPPAFDVRSGPGKVTLLEGSDADVPYDISYSTHVTMTGESTFVEDGEISVGDGGLRLRTVGTGTLGPAPAADTLRGAVLWEVEGVGSLAGVIGLVTSTFETSTADGSATEYQVLRLYLP